MNVKTIHGASIAEALAEARRQLGDDVVLLESVPPAEGQAARITVLADVAVRKPAPAPALPPAPVPVGFGYAAAQAAAAGRSVVSENLSAPALPATAAPEALQKKNDVAGRGRLFAPMPAATPAPAATAEARLADRLEAQLRLVHDRLDRLEGRFGGAVIGASQRWGAHPLFGRLLDQGLEPATVAALFDAAAAQGLAPEAPAETLRVALAQALRERLPEAAPRQRTGAQIFIGPSGAGKTTLIVQLGTHSGFYAKRRVSVLVIRPEDAATPYQDPTELYRRCGLPVQSVSTEAEMQAALLRTHDFDHLLIDTPPLPLREGAAHAALRRLRRLLEQVVPAEVHFVLDTTRALDTFDGRFLRRLPLPPALVALTHLDETPRWGRIAEWLMTVDLPVHLAASGPYDPAGLALFSPTRFAEQLMEL